jgi:hypothetical protein
VGDIYYPLDSGNLWASGWKHRVLTLGIGATWHNRKHD